MLVFTLTLTSCELVGDILEVGMWMGIIIVLAIIFIVYWLFKKIRR